MLGLIGILLSLALLMYLAYRGFSVILLAPVLALLAVLFDGGTPLLASYTQVFMVRMGKFAVDFFPLFLLGALFGKLMEDSGSVRVIAHNIVQRIGARRAILAIVLTCAVLTYGGVSVFVVAFAVYPLAAALFREANIPKRLIPGAIACGAFTFAMTSLPGSPQIQNMIPTTYFGTTSFAAPVVGLLASVAMFGLGMGWLIWRERRAVRAGEGYGAEPAAFTPPPTPGRTPPLWAALLPLIAVIGFNALFTYVVIPDWDASYLAEPKFGSTSLEKLLPTWAMILAMACAVLMAMGLNMYYSTGIKKTITDGVMGSLLPIFNTASEVGYGAVIKSLAAFVVVQNAMVKISPNPLVSEAVTVNVLAGITGSASGGLGIALESMGAEYLRMANEAGIDPELMHRIAVMSCGGLDSLPHNGAVITLLVICGLTHRQSYLDICIVSLVVPVLVTALTLAVMIPMGWT